MSGTVSTRWYFSDWISDPGLRASSLAARGLWIDLLAVAAGNKGKDHGFIVLAGRIPSLPEIARLVGSTVEEVKSLLAELELNGVFSRDRRKAIYSRRMVRAEKNRGNGRLGGNPMLLKTKDNKKPVNSEPKALIPEPVPEPYFNLESEPSSNVRSVAKAMRPGNDDFERFWKTYPKREGPNPKHPARAKFESLIRSGVALRDLVSGAAAYADEEAANIGTRHIAQTITWLNQRRWEDYAARSPPDVVPQPPSSNLPSDQELRLKYAERGKNETVAATSAGVLASGVDTRD